MSIVLRPFTEHDLTAAGEIAMSLWNGEVPDMPESVRKLIYGYLVRYYFIPESSFNLAAESDGVLCGFLFGAPSGFQVSDRAERWIEPQLKTSAELEYYRRYKDYLDANRKVEEANTRPEDLVLLLFASIRKGSGRLLMDRMVENTLRAGFRSHLLWTDDTCDVSYYFRNGYTGTARFTAPSVLLGREVETWIFRRELQKKVK